MKFTSCHAIEGAERVQDQIDFFQANSALALFNPIASSPISGRTVENRNCARSLPGRLPILSKHMRTTADGDSRSRVPSCGRRYADAPTAVPFTARGGGEFPPSCARQPSLLRTRAGLRLIRRSPFERRRSPARDAWHGTESQAGYCGEAVASSRICRAA